MKIRSVPQICFSLAILLGMLCCCGCSGGNPNYETGKTPAGNVCILRYKGTDTDVVIPETINGKIVTNIAINAFAGNTSIRSVTMPDSVYAIGNSAFKGCSALQSVTFPKMLVQIDREAFADCIALTSIQLPDSVKEIENRAFSGCIALKQARINPATKVSEYSFYNCKALACPTGSPLLDLYSLENDYRINQKPSLSALAGVFAKGYYPFYEALFGDNEAKTYTQAQAARQQVRNEGLILGENRLTYLIKGPDAARVEYFRELNTTFASRPKGKIIIAQGRTYGKTPELEVNFYTLAFLPKRYIPFDLAEVEYVIYINHTPARVAQYAGGGTITETKASVELYRVGTGGNAFAMVKNFGSVDSAPAPNRTATVNISMKVADGKRLTDLINQAVAHVRSLEK